MTRLMIEYKVISSSNPVDISEKVTDLLDCGYITKGDLIVIDDNPIKFVQNVVKYKEVNV